MNNNLMLKVISEIAKRELSKSEVDLGIPPPQVELALNYIGKEPKDLSDPQQSEDILKKIRDAAYDRKDQETIRYAIWALDVIRRKRRELKGDSEELSEDQNYSQQGTSMSKAELRDGIKNAIELYRLLQSGQELPPWAAAYVTLSSDYLHSVNEYMVEKSTQSMYQEGFKRGVTAKEIADMREWIADVQWEDLGEEDIKDLSDEEVIRGIDKNYEGGLKAFRRDISKPPTKK